MSASESRVQEHKPQTTFYRLRSVLLLISIGQPFGDSTIQMFYQFRITVLHSFGGSLPWSRITLLYEAQLPRSLLERTSAQLYSRQIIVNDSFTSHPLVAWLSAPMSLSKTCHPRLAAFTDCQRNCTLTCNYLTHSARLGNPTNPNVPCRVVVALYDPCMRL